MTETQALLKTQAEELVKLRTVLSNHDRFILDLARYVKYPPVVGGQAPPPVVDGTRENSPSESSGSENPATVATSTPAAVADKIPASTQPKASTSTETKKSETPSPKTKTLEKGTPAPAKKAAAKKSAPKKVASEDESSLSESEDELPPNVEAELQAALAAEIKNLDHTPEPKTRPEVKKPAPTRTRVVEASTSESSTPSRVPAVRYEGTSSDSDPSSVESDRSTSSREATSKRRPRQATKPDTIEITSRVAPSRPTRTEVSHQAQPPRRWGPAPSASPRRDTEVEKKKKVWGGPEEGRAKVVRKRMVNGKVLPPGSYPV